MDETTSTIPYAHPSRPRNTGALVAAGVLCFLGTLVPLAWLAIVLANLRLNQIRAEWIEMRMPFGLLVLEEVACTMALVALLIWAGVLLCRVARWAVHVAGAVMGIVLIGATGATFAEAIRRFSDSSPIASPSDHVAEIALRTGFGVVWPLAIILLLRRRSVRDAIVSRHGSMPAVPALLFVAGVVLIWYGLAATSLNEQAVPFGVYFLRYYSDNAVTLWRVGFAAAWVLAGALLLRRTAIGWLLAALVTLGAIASEVLLAAEGGISALNRTLNDSDAFRAALAMPAAPNAPWPAALYQCATHLCLLGLLLLVSPHFLFEDMAEPVRPSAV